MRYADPLIHFSWPKQPEARVGHAYAVRRSRQRLDAVRVPYPYRRIALERPLEREGPRLFEAIADLSVGDAAAVETFAREWGFLFRDTPWLSLEAKPKTGEPVRWAGQDLEAWRFGVAGLREARELWRAISEDDHAGIGKLVRIDKREGRSAAIYSGIAGVNSIPLPRQSLTDAGRAALAWLLTQRMESALGVGYDRAAPRKLRVVARPRDLLAAGWAQLAQHVTRDAAFACPACGEIFVVGLELAGRRRKHCSEACKAVMFRRRAKARTRRA